MIIVFVEPVVFLLGRIPLAETGDGLVAYLIELTVVGVVFIATWSRANYVYFKKRRHLFH